MQSTSREEIFNEKLKPLLQQVSGICNANDIPYLVAFRTDERLDPSMPGTCMVRHSCHCKDCGLSMEMQIARSLLTHDGDCSVNMFKLTPEQLEQVEKEGIDSVFAVQPKPANPFPDSSLN